MLTARRRIAGAFLVGFGLIALAYYFGPHSQTPQTDGNSLAVADNVTIERNYIRVTDSDKDGTPDWQEAIQKTDPVVLNEIDENYEMPDTLTNQFAIEFFEDMVLAQNYGQFGQEPEEIIANATKDFQTKAADELYTQNELSISSDNSRDAFIKYGQDISDIVLKHTVPAGTRSELEILKKAYTETDKGVLEELKPQQAAYASILEDTLKVSVPSELTSLHLDYINAVNAIHKDIEGMSMAFDDPLYTFLRIKRYSEDLSTLQVVLLEMDKIMLTKGIILPITN